MAEIESNNKEFPLAELRAKAKQLGFSQREACKACNGSGHTNVWRKTCKCDSDCFCGVEYDPCPACEGRGNFPSETTILPTRFEPSI